MTKKRDGYRNELINSLIAADEFDYGCFYLSANENWNSIFGQTAAQGSQKLQ